jgi:hypothetical protein
MTLNRISNNFLVGNFANLKKSYNDLTLENELVSDLKFFLENIDSAFITNMSSACNT